MAHVVNTVYTDRFQHLDVDGNPVDSLVQADYSERVATLTASDGSIAASAAIAITFQADGWYGFSFTPTALGNWVPNITYSAVSPPRRWSDDPVEVVATPADVAAAVSADVIAYLTANPINSVTVVSPVLANGTITGIVRGDDYTTANGTAIPINLTDFTIPGGATVVYTVYHGPNSVALIAELTITDAGPPAILTLELSRHDTLRLPVGTSQTSIVMTESGGAVTTLVDGTITVITVPS